MTDCSRDIFGKLISKCYFFDLPAGTIVRNPKIVFCFDCIFQFQARLEV